jgi:hypothetical protein
MAALALPRRGPSAGSTIEGRWIRLVPLAAYPELAVADLMFRLGMRPEMVAPGGGGTPGGSRFGEAAVISGRETGEMFGILSNVELPDYPGVAGLVIYVDQERTRAGFAMEAYWRYVVRMFELGVVKVQMEVMSFNTPVHRIMRRIGARPEVVLREHFYIAGRHWDGTLYAFNRESWATTEEHYRDMVGRPAAVAAGPRKTTPDPVRPQREVSSVNVDYLILADAAITAADKHYIHGAGWDTIVANSFPVFHPQMSAALRLRMASEEPTRRLTVDVLNSDGGSLLSAPIYTDVTQDLGVASPGAGDSVYSLVFNFGGLHFEQAGDYAVVVSIDGAEAHRTPFFVREVPAG